MIVDRHDRFRVVHARQFLAQRFDLFVISESPNAHTTAVFPNHRSDEVHDLTRDDPSDAEMTPASGQRDHPRPLVATLSLGQNVPSVRQIVENHAALWGLYFAFSTFLRDRALFVEQLAQNALVQIFEHCRLMLLVRHLFEVLAQRSVLWVELDRRRKHPDSVEHVLVVAQKNVQNNHRFPRGRGRCETETGWQIREWFAERARHGLCAASKNVDLVSFVVWLWCHFFKVGFRVTPFLFFKVIRLSPSPSSAKCRICSYVSFIVSIKGKHETDLRRQSRSRFWDDDGLYHPVASDAEF